MQYKRDQDLELRRSFKALGTSDFEDVLIDELHQIADELPLDRMCAEGGWPDDDTLALSVARIRREDSKVCVTVKCAFDEVLPTGCADITRSESGFGEVEITFDLAAETAYIRHEEDW